MTDTPVGLRFRETMTGGFSLGETDPKAGEKKGKDEGTKLTMEVAVIIHDLDRFAAEPDHPGELTGHVTFPPLGADIPATKGVFNLFSPAGDPRTKWMVYELAFEQGGKSYYLAGKKEVRDDPGFDLWKDTTTLFTRLHEGSDTTGPVVGAGVLHIGPAELLKMVSSITAQNAGSAAASAAAVAKFGRLFLGELWESYVKGANR